MKPILAVTGGFTVGMMFAAVVMLPSAASAQDRGQRGGTAVVSGSGNRGGSGGGTAAPSGGGGGTSSGGGAVSRGSGAEAPSSPRTASPPTRRGGGPAVARPREDRDPVGRAIPRPDAPSGTGTGSTVIITGGNSYGGYYPWGYGGLGLGGYYGGYYGWYDPWYDPYYNSQYSSYGYQGYQGRLRLKVKPSDAEVFVDGYYAGVVDEFDNIFQHLSIETGPHRIEVREDGYEPLTFEVRILPNRTVTYKGEMKKMQ